LASEPDNSVITQPRKPIPYQSTTLPSSLLTCTGVHAIDTMRQEKKYAAYTAIIRRVVFVPGQIRKWVISQTITNKA
jgi:hypothetical protein